MDTTADADLAQRAAHGDAAAFQELTVRYYRRIGAFVLRRVKRPDVVEDLTQDTFLEAYRSLRAGRLPENFVSWLFAIAHHCCGKWLRRRRPRLFDPHAAPELAEDVSPGSILEEVEEQQRQLAALETSLAELSPDVRRLLELKHRHGKTCEQIAGEVGRPVGTIKSLLARTYKLLRDRLVPAGGKP
jgi:RNA polymerase sigma-70 factor (ECF subfamily)